MTQAQDDAAYDALRASVLSGFASRSAIPILFDGPNEEAIRQKMIDSKCENLLHVLVFGVADLIILDKHMKESAKLSDDKKISIWLNGNVDAAVWILSNGLVDKNGKALLSPQDARNLNTDFAAILIDKILDLNGFSSRPEGKPLAQSLVGNSEGTTP